MQTTKLLDLTIIPAYNFKASYFQKKLKSEDTFHSLTSNISENFKKKHKSISL
jgi:hypothetical protein